MTQCFRPPCRPAVVPMPPEFLPCEVGINIKTAKALPAAAPADGVPSKPSFLVPGQDPARVRRNACCAQKDLRTYTRRMLRVPVDERLASVHSSRRGSATVAPVSDGLWSSGCSPRARSARDCRRGSSAGEDVAAAAGGDVERASSRGLHIVLEELGQRAPFRPARRSDLDAVRCPD